MEDCRVEYFAKKDSEKMQAEQAAQAHHRPVENLVVCFILVELVVTHLDCKIDAEH